MSWIGRKYARYQEVRRRKAGELCAERSETGWTKRWYVSDWAVLSRLEKERQRKNPDHHIDWIELEGILSYCGHYDVISFDVFDTLLCRNCGEPENLFLLLEKENGIPDFASARMAAEREARRKKQGEITLVEIYQELAWNGTVADAIAAMTAEWRMEQNLIAPHPMMLQVVKRLIAQGTRVIAVSDMYLSATQIGELLRTAGYPALERIFVSCEEGVGKAGGAIYRRVNDWLRESSTDKNRAESAPAIRILHFGDNDKADGECAASAGWDTALLMNPAKLAWEFGTVTPYGGDMVATSLRRRYRYDGNPEAHSPAYGVGYTVAGPMTVGFCQWVQRMQRDQGWEKLFFSARDGWIMHQVYTRYFGEAVYLPVSRAAVQMLDVEKQALSYCDNNLPAHLGTGETVGQVLRGMGLESMIPMWQADGLRGDAPFDETVKEQLQRLIIRDRERIALLFAPARENALRWLRQELGEARKAVIIDTGWKGSAGATLREFASENGLPTVLDTALMGTSKSGTVAVREERGELFSWLYSPGHDRDRMARMFEGENNLACALLEMLFMTELPQLESYAGEGFTYGQADERFRELARELQAGTMAFAADYDEAVKRAELETAIPAAAAFRYFEELLDEKRRILEVFGNYVHHMAPTPETTEITFADRMRQAGWIK